jgi:hypothetical protein
MFSNRYNPKWESRFVDTNLKQPVIAYMGFFLAQSGDYNVRQLLTGLAVLAFSAATPAVADSQAQPQPQPQASQANAPDQVICEREQDTGSRITGHKICHTRTQWAQIRRDDRDSTEQTQRERPMDYNGH